MRKDIDIDNELMMEAMKDCGAKTKNKPSNKD